MLLGIAVGEMNKKDGEKEMIEMHNIYPCHNVKILVLLSLKIWIRFKIEPFTINSYCE